ncbi:MAG: type II secretion system protein [Magnetococcales bacterium]|nr:type II secretion system protein [Magnetococcales bacterium]
MTSDSIGTGRRLGQTGFTLIELTVALMLGGFLLFSLVTMVGKVYLYKERIDSMAAMQRAAEELFLLATEGGVADVDGDTDINSRNPGDRVNGLHNATGWATPEATTWYWDTATTSNRAETTRFGSSFNNLTLTATNSGREITLQSTSSAQGITCTGSADPHEDCPAAESNPRLLGHLYNGIEENEAPVIRTYRSVANRTVTVELRLVPPAIMSAGSLFNHPGNAAFQELRPWERLTLRTTVTLVADY